MKLRIVFIVISAMLLSNVYGLPREYTKMPLVLAYIYLGEIGANADSSSNYDRMSFFEAANMNKGPVMRLYVIDSATVLKYRNLIEQASQGSPEPMPFDVEDCALRCHLSANDSLIWTSMVDPVIGAFAVNTKKPDGDVTSELILFSNKYIYRESRRYPMTDGIMEILEWLNQEGRRLKKEKDMKMRDKGSSDVDM